MKNVLAILLIILGFISNNAKADFARGLDAYQLEDYETAFQEWVKSAESGDLAAMRNVGHLFRWGKGVDKNLARASYWYHRAAREGFDKAQYNLAMLYLIGEGVEQNEKEAVRWLELASKQGHIEAKLKLDEIKGQKKSYFESKEENLVLEESQIVEKKATKTKIVPKVETKTEPNEELKIEPENVPSEVTQTDLSEKRLEKEQTEMFLVHIGSYNNEKTAVLGWQQMMKKFVGFERFDMTIKKVNIKNKGEMFRLFARGEKIDAIELCKKIKDKKEYCLVYDENNKVVF